MLRPLVSQLLKSNFLPECISSFQVKPAWLNDGGAFHLKRKKVARDKLQTQQTAMLASFLHNRANKLSKQTLYSKSGKGKKALVTKSSQAR